MSRKQFTATVLLILALVLAFATPQGTQGQDNNGPYPKMAPISQYMMADRDAEIALARTAAPESISRDAEILVLGAHGYETAVKGTNGFVCLVERSWGAGYASAEFWNPKNRSPDCYNPPAARSMLPLLLKRTELVLAGDSKEQIMAGEKAFGTKGVPALEPGAMCYMMSKEAYLTDQGNHNLAHLMFFVPKGTAWGESLAGSPVQMLRPDVPGAPIPVSLYIIATPVWSDGTSAVSE
ncbi:MAG TPA: hypothetical protein VGR81_00865 [Candidatus Acidoferrales bacterium]|nr:hypothetical protein [Candidatus Acidoferrales bacterium]